MSSSLRLGAIAITNMRAVFVLLRTLALAGPAFPLAGVSAGQSKYPPLLDATLDDLRQGLDSGLFTSVDLVNAYLARINETSDLLNTVIEINPDAASIAAELDALRATGEIRSPLHGVPVLVKDNIATNDAMNNTAGSYALLGAKVPRDSTVVSKLRKAGAVVLGKTNMSQWAAFRGFNISQGWSAYGGQTIGAYFPGQSPSGSSSGSAVAASVGLAWATLGTETAGSIAHPAHVNNLVGIKPTVGLTSRYLVVPITVRQDSVGPLARTVKDAAALLSVIAGGDEYDNYTQAIPWDETPDYVAACKPNGLEGKRIGVPRLLMDLVEADLTAGPSIPAFDDALEVLRAAGAEIIDNVDLPGVDSFMGTFGALRVIESAEALRDLPERYFDLLSYNPHNITSLADLQEFTQSHPEEGWPEHDTQGWDNVIKQNITVDDPAYWGNRSIIEDKVGRLGFTGAFDNHTLDAIALPTAWAYMIPAVLGWPVISVPMGAAPADSPVVTDRPGNLNATAPNQPFGLGFAGRPWSEEALIGMACAFEGRTQVRKKITPIVKPATELIDVVKATDGLFEEL